MTQNPFRVLARRHRRAPDTPESLVRGAAPRALTAIACALGLMTAAGCSSPSVEQVDTNAPVPVSVEPAHTATLETAISATGTISPSLGGDWTISAPDSARIAELPKTEGEAVKQGDLLVRFDDPTVSADLEAKRAAVQQAKVALDTAKAGLARESSLQDRGVAAARDVEDAKQHEADAEAGLAQANSALTAATALEARTVVRATFSGVVAKRWHNPGDFVDASASDPILRIINPHALQVVAAVPVSDLPRVVIGRDARVTAPGSGENADAHVLSKPGQVEPGSATADVRLSFAEPTKLSAGTMVGVEISAEKRPDVLVVPTAAVVHDGDEAYVMVAGTDNKAHRHDVKLGLQSGDLVQVTSGLTGGDQTITRGQDGLPDGAAITVAK